MQKPEDLGEVGRVPAEPLRLKKGDWHCPRCAMHNFATKKMCFGCSAPRPADQPRYNGADGFRRDGGGGPKPGDWTCPACAKNNFASRLACFSCSALRPADLPRFGRPREAPFKAWEGENARTLTAYDRPRNASAYNGPRNAGEAGGGVTARSGDWHCPECSALNFQSRTKCFTCGDARPADLGVAVKAIKPGDWVCGCGSHNFAYRTTCYKCSEPPPTEPARPLPLQ